MHIEVAKESHQLEMQQYCRSLSDAECDLSSFIKHKLLGLALLERTIARQHTSFAWLSKGDAGAVRALHAKRVLSRILKLDLAKAFDSVSWHDWIAALLSSASTKVRINGYPGRRICHARGLRQGDPLLPMLFVLVMEYLLGVNHRISMYADDVAVILSPSRLDLTSLKEIIEIFAGATGLVTYVSKSQLFPIRCSEDETRLSQKIFHCPIATFPCKYLGVPLSVYKASIVDFQPLIDKVAARTNLPVIPVPLAIVLGLSPWAMESIDRLHRSFLWAGMEAVLGGKCSVAWIRVCQPKILGGLGLPNLWLMA
ncbi:hypothetical protein U9M48_035228 [Paspalum notatum var. saurae]|uniref:Reverse transcriptase domain-containing protein n=1 Tax=Paspalum notatum var. saurae TaxID=547442 RepID=A0AAQ3UCP7_PASNO